MDKSTLAQNIELLYNHQLNSNTEFFQNGVSVYILYIYRKNMTNIIVFGATVVLVQRRPSENIFSMCTVSNQSYLTLRLFALLPSECVH